MRDQITDKVRAAKPYFRGDIEGLRGISIALVLLFHARIAGFNGGFVGVDVFFVISGFLITGLLVREVEEKGKISLAQFYARRARRLLPAAALVLIVTLLASYFLLPDFLVRGIAVDIAAAALYVSNMNFAYHATDYFAPSAVPSPVLHYWSLSVEEQFYLFWPAIVLLVTRKARLPRINIRAALIAIGISSFVFAIWLLKFNAPWAFFSLPTRAWELALGGLLAVSKSSLAKIPKSVAGICRWLGVSGVFFSALFLKESAPFPGVPALIPTISAALVIAAGARSIQPLPTRLLESAPLRFLGRISYSLYLWHWPLLVLPAALSIAPLTLAQRILLALGSIVLAAITQRFVEDPLRKGRAIGIKPRWNLITAMTVALTVAAAAFFINTNIDLHVRQTTSTASADQNAERLDAILSSQAPTPSPVSTPTESGPPVAVRASTPSSAPKSSSTPTSNTMPKLTASAKPKLKTSAKVVAHSATSTSTPSTPSDTSSATSQPPDAGATPTSSATPTTSGSATPTTTTSDTSTPTDNPTPQATAVGARAATIDFPVPRDINPSLATAKNDRALSYKDGCHTEQNFKPSTKPCLYGNLKGTKTIVLFGDSHALSWFPAVNKAAKSHGWKLLSLTMSACTPADIPAWNPTLNSVMKNCTLWRKASIAKIAAANPYVVIISGTRGFATVDAAGNLLNGAARITAYHDGMKRTIDKIKASAAHTILLQDIPVSNVDPPICLATHRSSTLACATPVEKAIQSSWQSEEQALATEESIQLIDPALWVCPTAPCPVVIGNLLVYSDPGHLTATFAAALARRMGEAITTAIR